MAGELLTKGKLMLSLHARSTQTTPSDDDPSGESQNGCHLLCLHQTQKQ